VKFTPYTKPFPFWYGPYSPARGNTTGFRIKYGKLGVWVYADKKRAFWLANQTSEMQGLAALVVQNWAGGRVLFLPCGYVAKPLQADIDRGKRVIIGEYSGEFSISGAGNNIDFSQENILSPGSKWPGPTTIGLECIFDAGDGSFATRWYSPGNTGKPWVLYKRKIATANNQFVSTFRSVRPSDAKGRVRLTVGGHVITSVQSQGTWKCFYLGKIDTSQFRDWDQYLTRK